MIYSNTLRIARSFTFQAAHYLPYVPEGHKCGRPHGHTYTAEITVMGEVDPEFGWVCDFADIDAAWAEIRDNFDHRNLNDYIPNPTAESIVWVLYTEFSNRLKAHVSRVRVIEGGSGIVTLDIDPRTPAPTIADCDEESASNPKGSSR